MKKNGFTLIETIGVIIIIAIIATVTIPIIFNSDDHERVVEQEKSDLRQATFFYLDAHPDLKLDLENNGEISIEVSRLTSEGYVHNITNFNSVVVRYNENGSYDITPLVSND